MKRRIHIEAFARNIRPEVALTMCNRIDRRDLDNTVLWHERTRATCLLCVKKNPHGRRRPMTTELQQQIREEREAKAAENAAFEAAEAPLLAGVHPDGSVPAAAEAVLAALALLDAPAPAEPGWWKRLRAAVEAARTDLAGKGGDPLPADWCVSVGSRTESASVSFEGGFVGLRAMDCDGCSAHLDPADARKIAEGILLAAAAAEHVRKGGKEGG